ncbi:MAG: isoprenyl transferase [Candidatus Omnitrophica bacterium]|nr:isoprenyl transferase [Candidatus Omnitrophota bacterium]
MMVDKNNLPKHIAIIMDGNGRWAKMRRLPKIMGYKKGAESIREILKSCGEIGVKYLTLYTFSTENWKRPEKEVRGLMKLLEEQLGKETRNLVKNNVKLNAIGRLQDLPERVQLKLKKAMEVTHNNTGVVLTLALSYGGRAEIIDAVKKIITQLEEGNLNKDEITEAKFSCYLYTKDIPDPDLLIRTSGEMRISNFLLWQISYAEIYVAKKLWPDFRKRDLEKAIEEYQRRQRKYGA